MLEASSSPTLISRFVLEHRLAPTDPLETGNAKWEVPAIAMLLGDEPVHMTGVSALLDQRLG
jgi:hypothetical protein